MLGMGQSGRVQRVIRFASACLLAGSSLWATWATASYWAPCAGSNWKEMNPTCAESMSSYETSSLFAVWALLVTIVVVLVATRVVPRFPRGAVAVAAVLIACPIADPGFYWVEWASADGVPGQGLWTACWLTLTGLVLLYPSRAISERAQADEHGEATDGSVPAKHVGAEGPSLID